MPNRRPSLFAYESLEARRLLSAASTPFTGTPAPLPGVIEAENFDAGGEGVAYHDTDAANLGGAYRPAEGVDLEATGESGGGYDVGWTHAGEWLAYTTSVATAGKYDLAVRVASPSAGAVFHVEVDGVNVSGPLAIANTGGWQTYMNVGASGVSLTAGVHVVKLVMDANNANGFAGNFNWLQFTPSAATGQAPYSGTAAAVPGIVQAEDFDNGGEGVAYHDTDAANLGGAYRATGVDIEAASDTNGGYDVAYTHAGEWLDYTINVSTAGNYDLGVRAADYGSGAAFHVEVDGMPVTASLAVPNTGAFQSYTTITQTAIPLTAGVHVVRLVMDANSQYGFAGNYNYLSFMPSVTSIPEAPFSGSAPAVTAKIQAEDFDRGGEGTAYHDADAANLGGAYRPAEGVDIESTVGGYDVGWTHAGEWLKYTITVPVAGTYNFDARVANVGRGASFDVEANGQSLTGAIAVPDTGGFQTFQDVTATGIALPAGTYAIEIAFDTNAASGFAGNIDSFQFTEAPKNLLFFGNSFTLYNNLPSVVASIAQADGHPRPATYVQANNGWTLSQHLALLASDGSNNIIDGSLPAGQTWDDVIFQDYSTRPLTGPNIAAPGGDAAGFLTDAATLLQEVHADSPTVRSVPIETWARGYDNTDLYPTSYPTPTAMQNDLLANYAIAASNAAAKYGSQTVSLAEAGEAWRALNWTPALYDGPDEYHPSAEGSLLAALMVYRSAYNEHVSDIPASAVSSYLSANNISAATWIQLTAVADAIG